MSSVQLNIDENKNVFLISGDTSLIVNNRRAKYYFEDFLKANFDESGIISIPYLNENKELLLKSIQDSLQKYKINQIDSFEIKEALNHYYKEKENFEIFSEKARMIWHNDVDIYDFASFKVSLETHLPYRRL